MRNVIGNAREICLRGLPGRWVIQKVNKNQEVKKINYTIIEEPRGKVYKSLIDFSLRYCECFLFVIREGIELKDSGQGILKSLEPHLIRRVKADKWPGTELFGAKADVFYYRCNKKVEALFNANSLFEWVQPNYPEDLCFLKTNDVPWFVTITHEKDGFFELNEDELQILMREVPGIMIKKT